jgi:hypothetical protein
MKENFFDDKMNVETLQSPETSFNVTNEHSLKIQLMEENCLVKHNYQLDMCPLQLFI